MNILLIIFVYSKIQGLLCDLKGTKYINYEEYVSCMLSVGVFFLHKLKGVKISLVCT